MKPPEAASGPLPVWSLRSVAVLTTVTADGPHAIPVSAPVRAADDLVLIGLRSDRDSLGRIRAYPSVALTLLTAGDVAFTARGRASVLARPLGRSPDYVAVAIEVLHVDDHRQAAFAITAGVERDWQDESERSSLGDRVAALREMGDPRDVAAG